MMVAALMGCLLIACGKSSTETSDNSDDNQEIIDLPQIEVSRLRTTEDGKVYLEVDGKAFPLFGAQIRLDIFKNCDKLSNAEIERYFKEAKNLNVNCVQVPLTWKMIEPEEGKYDYSMADFILGLANKYKLKIELLWFSTNFIGDSYTYLVPPYVITKKEVTMNRKWENKFHNLYGYYHGVVFDNEWVLKRESAAVSHLFNHIRMWDEKNGKTHPVITCQLHNEIDGLVRWRINEDTFTFRDGTPLTQERAWSMTLNAVNSVGLAIKGSLYKVATRVNYTSCSSSGRFPQCTSASGTDALKCEGVDFISVDPYMSDVSDIARVVESFIAPAGNYPLIAENRGYYDTTPSLILVTAALGGGYDIYDLATSKFIYDNNGLPWGEEGVLKYDFTDRAHTPLVRSILKGLTMVGEEVALTSREDFVAFNVNKSKPEKIKTQEVCTSGAKFTINTASSSIGFILDRGTYLLMYFTGPATVSVSNGITDDGKSSYQMKSEELLKVGFLSEGKLTSTTKTCIGMLY